MSSFTAALHDRLEAAATVRAGRRSANTTMMEDRSRREAAFGPVAEAIHGTIIRPMVEEVTRAFDNATVEHFKMPIGLTSRVMLARTDRYPASTELAIGIGPTADGTGALLTYQLQIIPELMSYTRSDSWTLGLKGVVLDEVRARVGDWLLRFTDTYLRLESEPNYQDWNAHLDPVCGMRISGAAAAHVTTHERRKIYFCSEECRERFAAHPELYLKGIAPLTG
jgi:YHS domain-containing protein